MVAAALIDRLLEAAVVPSFTRIGCQVRSRMAHWRPVSTYDLRGRVVLITGATSGIGLAAARTLVSAGATVIAIGRDESRLERLETELAALTPSGGGKVHVVVADMGDLAAVRAAAAVLSEHDTLHALVHNAGVLSPARSVHNGVESTIATQVLGPFLLTSLLLPLLERSAPARVITMASGGMYTVGLRPEGLELSPEHYRGSVQYALAKRAQVTLNELWAQRKAGRGVAFHALHPGWVDTPGVRSSLPTFHRLLKRVLRNADEGADTLIWLIADDDEPLATSGEFWHDRRVRPIHRAVARTRKTDTPAARAALWQWCAEQTETVDAS